jgi:Fe2+ transport system protein B
MNKERIITIALAGNANVGKSAIFNQLTGVKSSCR